MTIQLDSIIQRSYFHGLNLSRIEAIPPKISETSKKKKKNLSLPHAGNYLHSIYIISSTIYIEFTWH